MNNELKKIARRINRDGYINNHDNDTSKEGTLHKDAGAVVLLAKDSIGLWFGGNSCINSCFIGNDGYVHLSTYTIGGTVYRGSVVPTQEDIDEYNASVIDSCKIIDWIPLFYNTEEKKVNKSNIVKISAKVEDIITVLPSYLVDDYKGYMGMPTLVIHVDYPSVVVDGIKEPARKRDYYLTPFREYAFQVSGSIDGDGDYGSCEVVDLHAIMDSILSYSGSYRANVRYGTEYLGNRSNVSFYIIKGLLLQALDNFIYRQTSDYEGYTLDFNDKENNASRHLDGDVLDRFTKVCIAYLLIREGNENLLEVEAGASTKESLIKYIYNLPIYNSSTKEKTDLHPVMPEKFARVIESNTKKYYFI